MNKTLITILAVVGTISVLALTVVGIGVSASNQEVGLRNAITAKQTANQATFDNMWKHVDSISGGGSARGCSFGGKIHVKASLDSADRAKVLAHEIGHELLHWVDGSLDPNHSRSWRETEAESTAYAICSAYSIEANSELYLNSFGATRAMVKESTARIFKAVKEVLTFTQGTTETQEEA